MKVGVFKFSSCDGCQIAFFEFREMLQVFERFDVVYFLEAQSENIYEEFDLSFVEGSVSNEEDKERILDIRKRSKILVAMGACAISGGVQSAGNFEGILKTEPLDVFVEVDYELPGCPVSSDLLVDFLMSILHGKRPRTAEYPVCLECKRKGNICVTVLKGEVCLGPVIRAGCGAICPSFGRGCYGCYGPVQKPNLESFLTHFPQAHDVLKLSANAYNKVYKEKLWR